MPQLLDNGRAVPGDVFLGPVAAAPSPRVLSAALDPQIGLALWLRAPCPVLAAEIEGVTAHADFEHVAEGTPEAVSATIMQLLSHHGGHIWGPLQTDLAMLATLFTNLCRVSALRLRLEHTREVTCPRLHVDAVGLRLVCTYTGLGTEWQDAAGTIQRMSPAHVGVFKGRAWPDRAPRVLHRSPDMCGLPEGDRGRLVLCLDQLNE